MESTSVRAACVVAIAGMVAACGGPTTLAARMDHAENQARAAEALLDEADKRLEALEADRAEKLLADAKDRLSDPDIAKYPEHRLLQDRHKEASAKLVTVREEITKRELERAVLAQRQLVETALSRLEAAVEAMRRAEVTPSQLDEAKDAANDLRDKLANGGAIEAKDEGLAKFSADARKTLEKAMAEEQRAERVIAFREGPGLAMAEATTLAGKAKGEKDPEKRKELTTEALDRYRACVAKAKELLAGAPELAKTKVEVDGKTTSADALTSACEKQVESLDKKLAKLVKQSAAAAAPAKAKKKKAKKKRK